MPTANDNANDLRFQFVNQTVVVQSPRFGVQPYTGCKVLFPAGGLNHQIS